MAIPWFERFPARFEEEVARLAERGFEVDLEVLRERKALVLRGMSQVDPERRLEICYPDQYPSFPPIILDGKERPPLRRHHNRHTRQLCLFGPGGARWWSQKYGSDALDEAELVIALDQSPDPEDVVPEPVSARVEYDQSLWFLVPPPISEVRESDDARHFFFRMEQAQPNLVRRPTISSVETSSHVSIEADKAFGASSGELKRGRIYFLPKGSDLQAVHERVESYSNSLSRKERTHDHWFAFVIQEESGTNERTRSAWIICQSSPGKSLRFYRAFPYRHAERQARLPGLNTLDDKRVMFIGCGCLGSKIAVALAASGTGQMTLMDFDFFEPYNSVRHELGIDSFGIPKVHALAQKLVRTNPRLARPDATKLLPYQIGGLTTGLEATEHLVAAVQECDLVIDTTGSHQVSRWLNEECHNLNVPTIYASVTNGAWGGEIVRVVPRRTACWMCWWNEFWDKRPSSEPRSKGGFFPPGCDQPSFTGTSYDAGVVANFATMMAVETLLREVPGRKDFEGDYILWNGRDEGGAPLLQSTIRSVNPDPSCYLGCGH